MDKMSDERWGRDLRLLENLERASNRMGGGDLRFVRRPPRNLDDLATLRGAENLQQALLLRFVTPKGELAPLGHPDYGCDLYRLVGEPNTPTNRNRAKLYVLEALAQEPRIEQVLTVAVTEHPGDRTRIDVKVVARATGADTPINLVFPFFL
jgi:phage baseplate assembly protein W